MPSKGKIMDKRMRSRWSRHCQRLGGAIPMWHVLSFTGRFDDEFFKDVEAPPTQEGERSAEQKEKTKNAVLARARFRLAESYDRLRARSRARASWATLTLTARSWLSPRSMWPNRSARS